MKERYNKQTIVLETMEGTSRNYKECKKRWKHLMKMYFPHYHIKKIIFEKGLGDNKE